MAYDDGEKASGFDYDRTSSGWTADTKEVCHYDYHDELGNLLFRKFRGQNPNGTKTFIMRHPNPLPFDERQMAAENDHNPKLLNDWLAGRPEGIGDWLYRLHELKATKPGDMGLICEGEKDADTAVSLGFDATTMQTAQSNGQKTHRATSATGSQLFWWTTTKLERHVARRSRCRSTESPHRLKSSGLRRWPRKAT